MKMVPLGDLIVSAPVRRAGADEYPVLSMTMHEGLVDQSKKFKKRIASADTSDYKVITRGQLVVGFPIDEGVLDFQTLYDASVVSPAYGVWELNGPTGIDTQYLKMYLRSPRAMAYYKAKLRGSTARRRSLPAEVFLALRVPTPHINEQRRIAAILEHADALRAKRRQVISHLDDLAQSIFMDMFGDPIENPRTWPRIALSEVVHTIDSGSSPVCEARPAQDSEWAVLKLGAVSSGTFNADENKAFLGDISALRRAEVRQGDMLLSRKNTKELVGATVVVHDVPPRRLLPDLIFRLRLNRERIDAEYLHALLSNRHKRPQLVALASGSASSMSNISQSRLLRLPVELPPLGLQQQYSANVLRIVALKEHNLRAQRAYDELFASLQSRAFRGEL